MVQAISTETLSPAMFATVSSSDLNTALSRVSRYKPLVGPVRLRVEQNHHETRAIFTGVSQNDALPDNLAVLELAFWVHIARIATRERIIPKALHLMHEPPHLAAHEAFFDSPITISHFNGVVFSSVDAQKPFLTTNHAIWSILEPELNKRLQDLSQDSLFSDRVRACLIEMLASGTYSMGDVASKLAISSRTLHRRLKDEETTFQNVLDELREELARHYLSTSDYSTAQIAFLLGYEEANSFYRAFRTWTGQTPDAVRTSMGLQGLQPDF
jgi:AraC-like DNA-binding protein